MVRALGGAGEEVLRAVQPVVLGPLLPHESAGRGRLLDEAVVAADDYLAHLSLPLQRQARMTLALVHAAPVRALLLRTHRPWHAASPAQIEAFLRRAQTSRVLLLRRIYDFLHSMSVIGWFDQTAAWDGIGYPGPPMNRALVRHDASPAAGHDNGGVS